MFRYLFLLLFIIIPSLFAQVNWQLYQISDITQENIKFITVNGGIIDQYVPGKHIRVYLQPQLRNMVRNKGMELKKIPNLVWSEADSLAWHISQTTGKKDDYHTYNEATQFLQNLQSQYPSLCELHTIGQTVQGREMWILKISDNVSVEEAEPEFKFIATMHGDEIVGQELVLKLAEFLLSTYHTNSRCEKIINNTELWLMPNMNFDGTNINYNGAFNPTRFNANGVDLNRNFPDREFGDPPYTIHPYAIQPETQNIIQFTADHNFVLSANLHGGALVVNYPWDKYLPGDNGTYPYAGTDDDTTFIDLSLTYSRLNLPMFNSSQFPNGITNGAVWYETSGCIQDWNLFGYACMDVTIELSNNKWPPYSTIEQYWNDNKFSMLAYIEKLQTGIHGTVRDSLNGNPLAARIKTIQTGSVIYSDEDPGDFYRLIVPGLYDLEISAPGYSTKIISDVPVDSFPATILDVKLLPQETYQLNGLVIDYETNEPLATADIQLKTAQNQIYSTTSAGNGKFSLIVPPDSYFVDINQELYFNFADTITINSDTVLTFSLKKIYPVEIIGQVSSSTGSSVDGAIVWSQGISDTTGFDGYFNLKGLMPGNISVFAYLFGFKTARLDTVALNGDSLNAHFMLTPGNDEIFINFEHNFDLRFDPVGDWEMGIPTSGPGYAYSGVNCWATNLQANYSNGLLANDLKTAEFSIMGLAQPVLEFRHWYEFEQDKDGGNVKISTDGGNSWEIVYAASGYPSALSATDTANILAGQPVYSGSSGQWIIEDFELFQYKAFPSLQVKFDVGTDNDSCLAGWYIDDFRIFDGNATSINENVGTDNGDKIFKVRQYPNPANPVSIISLEVLKDSHVKIDIYDITGAHVKKLSDRKFSADKYKITWDTKNRQGVAVSSGTYFVHIKNAHQQEILKFVLLR